MRGTAALQGGNRAIGDATPSRIAGRECSPWLDAPQV